MTDFSVDRDREKVDRTDVLKHKTTYLYHTTKRFQQLGNVFFRLDNDSKYHISGKYRNFKGKVEKISVVLNQKTVIRTLQI